MCLNIRLTESARLIQDVRDTNGISQEGDPAIHKLRNVHLAQSPFSKMLRQKLGDGISHTVKISMERRLYLRYLNYVSFPAIHEVENFLFGGWSHRWLRTGKTKLVWLNIDETGVNGSR